ncbi:MAG: LPS export ABC transporter periplasmic protein LptC [Betaproteobacteria bacterium]
MKDRLTLLIAILLLGSVTATSYWYARSLRLQSNINVARPGSPDFETEKMVVTQFDAQGRAQYKLFAEKLVHFGENDDVELSLPRLVSLRPDRPQVEVRAQRGRVENLGEKVHLHGDVVLTRTPTDSVPALRADTAYLLAQPDEDKYSTDQPVVVRRGEQTISAQRGMTIDNIARTSEFRGDVKINLPPARSPQ